ncbi:UdgX family uracil-DNA binding protein [Paracoccus jiaweipingae]|uniref:UdgX family uracil-DNA binding protein n=1 Tax=unclassified Paracoccus (in: a-proteobacteria) TaxID=2688777 RepID=UPI0037BC9444
MYRVDLPALGFDAVWRAAARRLASHRIAPADVDWSRRGDATLFAADPLPDADGGQAVSAPRDLTRLCLSVLCHSDPQAPALAYQALLRHQHDRRIWSNPADPLTRRLQALAKSVGRDIHKMHAFVRFREVDGHGGRRRFGAWFQPDHHILEAATPFFARRFADMDWLIATPQGVARFDGQLRFGPPVARPDLPDDATEVLWGTYFAHIFNPARIKLGAMRSEMPVKYWKNLPETQLIPQMLADAGARVAAMRAAAPSVPPKRAARILERAAPDLVGGDNALPADLAQAAAQARHCTRCDLCQAATQTVWGSGDASAPLMIVGEQPGDAEDLAGRPFVGPAGQLLHAALAEVSPGPVWLTNAVKHFKFRPRGKQRLHQNPDRGEIRHCRWWLGLERRFIQPQVTLALGASAAYALTGDDAPLTARRGKVETAWDGGAVVISWHPSYILRLPDAAKAAEARAALIRDLRLAAELAVADGGGVVGATDRKG